MSIIQQIFSDHFNDVVDSGISIRPTVFDNVNKCFIVVTINLDILFSLVIIVANSKWFLSLVKADFVIPAVICILLNGLLLCLLNLFAHHTVTAFLLFLKNFVCFSVRTILY